MIFCELPHWSSGGTTNVQQWPGANLLSVAWCLHLCMPGTNFFRPIKSRYLTKFPWRLSVGRWGTQVLCSAALVARWLLSSAMCSRDDSDWHVHSLTLPIKQTTNSKPRVVCESTTQNSIKFCSKYCNKIFRQTAEMAVRTSKWQSRELLILAANHAAKQTS